MNELEIIADFNNHTEADFAKGLLELYGIKSSIQMIVVELPVVKLLIPKNDLKKAKEILKLLKERLQFFRLNEHFP